MSRQKTI